MNLEKLSNYIVKFKKNSTTDHAPKTVTKGINKRFVGVLIISLFTLVGVFSSNRVHAASLSSVLPSNTFAAAAPACPPPDTMFFVLWPWYHYFIVDGDFQTVTVPAAAGGVTNVHCKLNFNLINNNGTPNPNNFTKLWLIALVVFEDLLRVAGIAAVGFIIYGGIRFITSTGDPKNIATAREIIIYALIGAAVATVAAVTVSFLGSKLGAG